MKAPTQSQREQQTIRPNGSPFMHQTWRDLLFLHWESDPAKLQETLPDGLYVDTLDGKAFVGLVPFFMDRIRPNWVPALPWLSWFLEFNVRTYVHDEKGTPGVWFYSLDCNQPIAVWGAQTLFKLPYFRATMRAEQSHSENGAHTRFWSQRKGIPNDHRSLFNYRPKGPCGAAPSGTLEYFLLERYILFAVTRRGLATGQVVHPPYEYSEAELAEFDGNALKINGLDNTLIDPDGQPMSALYSPGVDVEVFSLKSV